MEAVVPVALLFVLLHIIFSLGIMKAIISIVEALASKAAECTVDVAARELSYLLEPKIKFENLRTKVQELKDAKERVQQAVDAAKRNGEVIFDGVQTWLTEVDEKISDQAATQLQEDEEKATKTCFAGFCPDFMSRYHLTKKAGKEADAITQLLNKKDEFIAAVGYRHAVEPNIRPDKDYEAFGSRNGAFHDIMTALEDDAVSIIGVYGMGGVGKTTLAKEAVKQANEKRLFNEVVLVSIKQNPNMVNIQEEVAEKLGMKMSEKNVDVRAALLRERLNEKRVLVVLDDIWESLELEALGISCEDKQKGCKMLMTSRRLDVLQSLNSEPNISIETLKEDEAWNFFKKMAGLDEGSDFQSTAVEVAKRCAGLPIAIATIAKALKPKKNLFEWKNALRQLNQPSERNFKGIPKDAYSAIELSYTFLDEERRPILLLCSVMAHNADPEDLLRYAIGLGFIHDLNSIEASRDSLLSLVNDLKASCLLLEGSLPNRFDLHDVVRDVAQSIALRDLHWLSLFNEWPEERKMKESQLINLQNVEVSELLYHELDCPNLTYFSICLEGSSSEISSYFLIGMRRLKVSLKISSNFFTGMQRLKVLEFDNAHFTSLPSSISSLKTLSTLRLLHCELKDIVILGELKTLEILDLRRSKITVLPKEIGQLIGLKLLDLSHCDDLDVISPNVLSKLSRLEELYLYHSFDKWEVERIENPRNNASLVELQHLSRLITLEVNIPDVEAIPKNNLFFGRMERYKISIGAKLSWLDDIEMKTSRMLKLRMNKSIHLVDGIKHLLRKTHSLSLNGMEDIGEMQMLYHPNVETIGQLRSIKVRNCNMMKNLFSFTIIKRLRQLEILEVSDCESITELIEEKEEIDENDILELNKLRILWLSRLNRFNGLWYSESTYQSSTRLFDKKVSCPALKVLELNGCHKLKYVFASSMVKRFVHLETLRILECDEMEGVIEGTLATEEGTGSNIRVFPKLDSFELERLPKLRNFCCAINPIEFPSLKRLVIRECRALNAFTFDVEKSRGTTPYYLFDKKVSCPALKVLELNGYHKLKYVFASSMVKRFVHLETLKIFECDEMEGVIEGTLATEEGTGSNIRVFPKLDSFELERLPKLRNFCCAINPIEFPSLKRLRIGRCRALNAFTFDVGKSTVTTPHYLFDEKVSCPALEVLNLKGYHKLKYVFASSMVKRFVHLKTLLIFECDEMERVIEGTLAVEEGTGSNIRVFPKLDFFELERLLKLRNFCCAINPIEFPSLKSLVIRECRALNAFTFDVEKRRGTPPYYLFDKKVLCPALEVLNLEGYHKLKYVFTSPMVKSFVHLKTLTIFNCYEMDGIVEGTLQAEEGTSSSSTKLFPKLDSIKLNNLPKLRRFCCAINPIEFPLLKSLRIGRCRALNAFTFDVGKSTVTTPHYLFDEKFMFPNLQELSLGWNAGMKDIIWHCNSQHQQQLLSLYFPNLKVVTLFEYPKEVTVLPSYLFPLLSLPNLQTLDISSSCFKEMIFQSEEGGEEKPASLLLSQITELNLEFLDELMHLWKEKEGFPILRTLVVTWCHKLKANLVPSSVSFLNLVTLRVEYCNGIIKLITHSTAKSLVQLKQMSIEKCENIEEIVQGGDDDDDDEDGISFPQLNRLELVDLPKLESFCSSDKYTFGFPSLEVLVVDGCVKMKKFSEGHSNTPMLHKVGIKMRREKEWRWEGSLDGTIQKLFREKYDMIEGCENLEEDQSKPSTFNVQELENSVKDEDNSSTSKDDQNKPSTSNTQNVTEEVKSFITDKDNSSIFNSE